MRQTFIALLAALSIMGATSAAALQTEAATRTFSHRTAWSFDPVHGVMQGTPVNLVSENPSAEAVTDTAEAVTTYTGDINVTAKINLLSSINKGAALRCSASFEADYDTSSKNGSLTLISLGTGGSSESVDAVVSGNTATCKFTIHYAWTIPASTSTTTVTLRGIGGSVGVAEDLINSEGVVARVYRSTTVAVPGPATMPPDGSTTTLTASTVL